MNIKNSGFKKKWMKLLFYVLIFSLVCVYASFIQRINDTNSFEHTSCINKTKKFVEVNWGNENQQPPTEYFSFYDVKENKCFAKIRQDYSEFYDVYLFDIDKGELLEDFHHSRSL